MSSSRETGPSLPMLIGEVSRRSGRAPSAIRYYEQLGLIQPPQRVGGRRSYPPEVLHTLAVIDTAQRAGLTLEEVRLLLRASDDPTAIEALRTAAQRRLPELIASIDRAQLVRRWLEAAAKCACPTLDDCPLFEPPSLPPDPTPRMSRDLAGLASRRRA